MALAKILPIIFQNEFEDWLVIFLDALTKYKNDNLLGKGAQANTPRVTQIVHILKGQKKLQAQEVEEEDDDHGVIETFKTNITKNGKIVSSTT